MAEKRQRYQVNLGGTKHTLLLTEEDAKRYQGATKLGPSTKKVSPENKQSK